MVTVKDFKEWQERVHNFMTPDLVWVKQKGNTFIEISTGTGFEQGTHLFAVSVIRWNGNQFVTDITDINKSFHDEKEALNYANELYKKL